MTRTDHRKVKRVLESLPGKHFFISAVDGKIAVMSDVNTQELASLLSSIMIANPSLIESIRAAVNVAEKQVQNEAK